MDNSLAKTRAQFFASRMTLLEAPFVTHFTTSLNSIEPNLDDDFVEFDAYSEEIFSSPSSSGYSTFRAFFMARNESVSRATGFVA